MCVCGELLQNKGKVEFFWGQMSLQLAALCAEDQWILSAVLSCGFGSGSPHELEGSVSLSKRLSASSHKVFLLPASDQRALCLLVCNLGNRGSE